ncbi:MarR family transcriptional regulator [Cohnella xylanilytica]|uniref:MarR family transcriptional regulator n=2 Tax=Cohnella xylanilytica TaxID=557555 RepID=A0A841TZJ4_9BACL|nr:MarR family transcriptional regulator [Cohnella xylanilytica]
MRRAEAVRLAGMTGEDLDRSAYLLLRYLEAKGPVGIKSLADELQLDISTASRQIAALEAKGYVERAADPRDARVSLLRVADAVPAMLAEARANRKRFYAKLLEEWPEEESRKLGELLGRFNRTVEQRRKR